MERERTLTFQDLVQLVELIKSSANFNEFHLRMGDVELDLRRGEVVNGSAPAVHAGNGAAVEAPAPAPTPAPAAQRPEPPAPAPAAAAPSDWPADSTVVKSPMVGTFYRSAEPGAKPFIEIGDTVGADATVCIIEVMKLMNSIAAGADGVVTHVLVKDGDPVEFGQPLVVIAPNSAEAGA